MLVEEFFRADIHFDVSKRKIVDAQKIFHLMEPRNLTAAFKYYCDGDLTNAHSAEADTLATFDVIDAQVGKYEGKEIKDKEGNLYVPVKNDMKALHELSASNQVDLAGRMVYNSKGVPVFNFGKFKNVPVIKVLNDEPNYYDWMMRGDFPQNTKHKLTEIKLSQFNKK